jgi:DNA-binding NtrC family response regulator
MAAGDSAANDSGRRQKCHGVAPLPRRNENRGFPFLAGPNFPGEFTPLPRLLLVEDDRDVRVLMEHVLLADRYQVDVAATVSDARRLLAENDYDVVVADGILPDGTGIEVADEAQEAGTPAIIITAYGFILPQQELARFDVLLKPVRPAELVAAVEDAMRTWPLR